MKYRTIIFLEGQCKLLSSNPLLKLRFQEYVVEFTACCTSVMSAGDSLMMIGYK